MTDQEVIAVVDRVCSAWNQNLATLAKKEMYSTWMHVLSDLDNAAVRRVIDDLIIDDERFMPRVGTVRKRVLSKTVGAVPPDPIVAWQQFRVAAEAAGSGVGTVDLHDLVRVALGRLGGTGAFGMHTNGDRESFFTVYRAVVSEWEQVHYGIKRDR